MSNKRPTSAAEVLEQTTNPATATASATSTPPVSPPADAGGDCRGSTTAYRNGCRCGRCRAAKAAYQRGRRFPSRKTAKMRDRARCVEIVAELKGRPCTRCGGSFPAVAMDLHHPDPTNKSENVSRLVRDGRLSALIAEIAKCEVLCANCHRVVEAEMREEEDERGCR